MYCIRLLRLFPHALYGPLLLAERAAVVLLHPERHAAEMEAVVALAPHHHAVLLAVGVLLALTLAPEAGVWNNQHLPLFQHYTNTLIT